MVLKKRRVFLKKRPARFAKLDVLAVLGAVALIAFLTVMAFQGGQEDDPDIPLTGQDSAQTATAEAPPSMAIVATEVDSLNLAVTGIDNTPLLIGGISLVLLGAAMEKSARRRHADALRLETAAALAN